MLPRTMCSFRRATAALQTRRQGARARIIPTKCSAACRIRFAAPSRCALATAASTVHAKPAKATSTCPVTRQFIWFHFQQNVKRALHMSAARTVNAEVAANMTSSDVDNHSAELLQHWEHLKQQAAPHLRPWQQACTRLTSLHHAQAPEFTPYCTTRESYTSSVGAKVVGSKLYWYAHPNASQKSTVHACTHGVTCQHARRRAGVKRTRNSLRWRSSMVRRSTSSR